MKIRIGTLTIGQIIILKGISQHGKQRIDQWGEVWIIDSIEMIKIGIFVKEETNINSKEVPDSFRWLDVYNDSDMEIISIL